MKGIRISSEYYKRLWVIGSLVCLLALGAVPAWGADLKLYCPGGLKEPMEECAEAFSGAKGISMDIISGEGPGWIADAKKDADLISLGVAHLYSQILLKYPDRSKICASPCPALPERRAGKSICGLRLNVTTILEKRSVNSVVV